MCNFIFSSCCVYVRACMCNPTLIEQFLIEYSMMPVMYLVVYGMIPWCTCYSMRWYVWYTCYSLAWYLWHACCSLAWCLLCTWYCMAWYLGVPATVWDGTCDIHVTVWHDTCDMPAAVWHDACDVPGIVWHDTLVYLLQYIMFCDLPFKSVAWYILFEFWNGLNAVSYTVSVNFWWTRGCRISHRSALIMNWIERAGGCFVFSTTRKEDEHFQSAKWPNSHCSIMNIGWYRKILAEWNCSALNKECRIEFEFQMQCGAVYWTFFQNITQICISDIHGSFFQKTDK